MLQSSEVLSIKFGILFNLFPQSPQCSRLGVWMSLPLPVESLISRMCMMNLSDEVKSVGGLARYSVHSTATAL